MVKHTKFHPPTWVAVGNGRLGLYHRLKRMGLTDLKAAGCDVVVTLLSAREGAENIGAHVQEAGIAWLWLPLENGRLPRGEAHERLMAAVPDLSAHLDQGQTILIHCSAGIHRTGMLAYGLLRWRGLDDAEAMRLIAQVRRFTAEGLTPVQKKWAELIGSRPSSPLSDERT